MESSLQMDAATEFPFHLYISRIVIFIFLLQVNEFGASKFSEPVSFSTAGSAPNQPQAPGLSMSDKSSLELVWSKRLCDEEFVLQMDDRMSGHGFLPCYTGSNCHHICTGLRSNTQYRFRLRAQNGEGMGPWSEEACYTTFPDVPGPPLRPASKGRLHAHSFKVRWDPPADNGGSPITSYILELDDGANGWRTVGQGLDLERVCDGLVPGTLYKVRVACASAGGHSPHSEVCHISTEPVCPGQCAPPRVHGKPKSSSLQLKWGWPETDGGSPVAEFEIAMTEPDNATRTVYRGAATECVVASLLPGRPYLFQVRAHNKMGAGNWSESLEVVSGAGPPDQPKDPGVVCKAGGAIVSWEAPISNGAIISEYQLEFAMLRRTVVRSNAGEDAANSAGESEDTDGDDAAATDDGDASRSSDDDYNDDEQDAAEEREEEEEEYDDESPDSDDEEVSSCSNSPKRQPAPAPVFPSASAKPRSKPRKSSRKTKSHAAVAEEQEEQELLPMVFEEECENVEWKSAYAGSATHFELRSLVPAATYSLRVCALNSAGKSEWSNEVAVITPPATPGAVESVKLVSSSASSMVLSWPRPEAHGAAISHYNVDWGTGAIVATDGSEARFTLTDLKPDMAYNIRIQVTLRRTPNYVFYRVSKHNSVLHSVY